MTGEVNLTKSPIVKIENASLDSFIDVSGLGDFKIVTFERQLIWIRSATANITLMRKGKILRSVAEFNDYYGYLKSAESAIEEAVTLAKTEEIAPGDSLSIVVTVEITDEPAIFDTSSLAMQHMETFPRQIAYLPISFKPGKPQLAYSGSEDMDNWVAANSDTKFGLYNQVPWIQPKKVLESMCLWDSSTHLENPTAEDDIATFIMKHRADAANHVEVLFSQRDELQARLREFAKRRVA